MPRKGHVAETRTYENEQSEYTDRFEIECRREGGVYWMYATDYPSGPFANRYEESHLRDDDGWICVASGKEPKSFQEAEAIVFYWMNGLSEFIRTGTFSDEGGTVEVPD